MRLLGHAPAKTVAVGLHYLKKADWAQEGEQDITYSSATKLAPILGLIHGPHHYPSRPVLPLQHRAYLSWHKLLPAVADTGKLWPPPPIGTRWCALEHALQHICNILRQQSSHSTGLKAPQDPAIHVIDPFFFPFRSSYLTPMLKPDYVGRKIVEAIQKEKLYAIMPASVGFLFPKA